MGEELAFVILPRSQCSSVSSRSPPTSPAPSSLGDRGVDLARVRQPFKGQGWDLGPSQSDLEACFSNQQLFCPL